MNELLSMAKALAQGNPAGGDYPSRLLALDRDIEMDGSAIVQK